MKKLIKITERDITNIVKRIIKEMDSFGFEKSMSEKPKEVYRIYADLGNDKVGVTGWYTKNMIDSLKSEIEENGYKIIKIEKSTDEKDLK